MNNVIYEGKGQYMFGIEIHGYDTDTKKETVKRRVMMLNQETPKDRNIGYILPEIKSLFELVYEELDNEQRV